MTREEELLKLIERMKCCGNCKNYGHHCYSCYYCTRKASHWRFYSSREPQDNWELKND